MRLLLTGDWQVQVSSIQLAEQAHKIELDLIKKYKIDVHIDLGDGKEEYSPVAVGVTNFQLKRARKLHKLLGHENCFRLNGNHDRIGQHSDSRNWLPVFKDHAICIDTHYVYVKEKDLAFCFLPFNKDVNELKKQAKRLSKESCKKKILFFHCDVRGASYNNVRNYVSESKLTLDKLCSDSYIKCFGGHIHKRQTLGDNVHYVGNPFPTDSGEVNQEKGFIIYDTDTNKVQVIKSNLPGIYTLEYLKKNKVKKIPDGSEVKTEVEVKVADDYYQTLGIVHDEIVKLYPNAIPHVIPDFVDSLKEKIDIEATIDIEGTEASQVKGYLDLISKDGKERQATEAYMNYVLSTVMKKSCYAKGLTLESVEAHNILSFKDVKLNYRNRGICLVRGINKDSPWQSNGAGKSNLLALLPIAHSGKTFKDQKFSDIVNDHTPDEKAWVRTKETTYSGDKLEIYRQFNPSKLIFTVNGKDASQGMRSSGKKDTQGLIEEYTGYSFDTLSSALYIDQSISQLFLCGTVKERAELLHKFLNLDRFAVAHKIANKHYSMMDKLVSDIDTDIALQELLIKETKERILDLQLVQKEHILKAKKLWYKAVKEHEVYKERISQKLIQLSNDKGRLSVRVLNQEKNLSLANKNCIKLEALIDIQERQKKKSLQCIKSNTCTLCMSKLSEDHVSSIIKRFTKVLAKLQIRLDDLKAYIKNTKQDIVEVDEKISDIDSQIDLRNDKLNTLHAKARSLKSAYIEEKSSVVKESVGLLKYKLHKAILRKNLLDKLRYQQLGSMIIIGKGITGFGRDGLPLFINRLICPRLNAAAKYYSKLFIDNEIQVIFTATNNGSLEPIIKNINGGKKLSGQSLGEKTWAGLITAFAVRDIAQPTNILILDEPGVGLDPEGSKQLGARLSKLVGKFETLLVVTHNRHIEEALVGSNTITVVKSNSISKVR